MTDHEATAAVEAVARQLRDRDPGTDNEVLAREIIVMLQGRGWRPTEARTAVTRHRPAGHGTEPTDGYLAARQALDARLACREPGDGDA